MNSTPKAFRFWGAAPIGMFKNLSLQRKLNIGNIDTGIVQYLF